VSKPIDAIGRETDDRIPYLAPEVALLYKSSNADYRSNQPDFDVALPLLNAAARSWLAGALDVVSPQHPWRVRLADA
ncbi:MAG TPA: amino acid transporter, partial [Dehalococcoidia bacterium]